MKTVIVYTDGACSGNPGPGGWGVVLLYRGTQKELSGYCPLTTNQRMELLAAISALEALRENCVVQLHSDSAYLINAFRQNWLTNWEATGWTNSRGDAVSNRDLWERLSYLSTKHTIEWIKVKGHSDNAYNNRCDELARAAIKNNSQMPK